MHLDYTQILQSSMCGRPLSSLKQQAGVHQVSGHQNYRYYGWSGTSAEQLSDAIDSALCRYMGELIERANVVSVTLDVVTLNNTPQGARMSVHLYVCLPTWEWKHCFVGLPVIQGRPNAETLFELLKCTLAENAGLKGEQLARKLVQLARDGASVLQGQSTGLGVRLKGVAPFLLTMHCHAHRLDLVSGSLNKGDPAFALVDGLATAPFKWNLRCKPLADELRKVRSRSGCARHAASFHLPMLRGRARLPV